MAMARSASGGTGVGPGAKRYFFCIAASSIDQGKRNTPAGLLFGLSVIAKSCYLKKIIVPSGRDLCPGLAYRWDIAGVCAVSRDAASLFLIHRSLKKRIKRLF